MTARDEDITAFLKGTPWSEATRTILAGDASNRRYDRLTLPDAGTAVLMDAPASRGEDVRPFIRMTDFLRGIGLSAPSLLKSDPDKGFLLIEDLGDALFARLLKADPSQETALYDAAVDVLVRLHQAPVPDLSPYNAETTVPLAALAFDWYQRGAEGEVSGSARSDLMTEMDRLLRPLDALDPVVIQRDYHAENLLWLPDRKGAARVGLLDYQDAMLGHPAYDLVSILQDARRDVSSTTQRQMIDAFLDRTGHGRDGFLHAYAILGTQRNLRILGVFARLCLRDGKAHYVDLIPRVWGHIRTNLQHPALQPVAQLIDTHLPEPAPDILERLKRQCATQRTP